MQILTIDIPLLTVLIVTRALGHRCMALPYVGLVIGFGFGYTGPRSISKMRDNPPVFSRETSLIVGTQFILGIISVSVFLLLLPFLPYRSNQLMLGPAAAGSFALADRLTQAPSGVIVPVITAVYPFVCRISGRIEAQVESHIKRTFFQGIVLLAALRLAISLCGRYCRSSWLCPTS